MILISFGARAFNLRMLLLLLWPLTCFTSVAKSQTPSCLPVACYQNALQALQTAQGLVTQAQQSIDALQKTVDAKIDPVASNLKIVSIDYPLDQPTTSSSDDVQTTFPFVVQHAWIEIIENTKFVVANVKVYDWGKTTVSWHYDLSAKQPVRFRVWGVPY